MTPELRPGHTRDRARKRLVSPYKYVPRSVIPGPYSLPPPTYPMSRNLQGAVVNGAGTRIAAARVLGTAAAVATATPARDVDTLVSNGNQLITIKAAINLGILQRDDSGTLVELNPPAAPTITNGSIRSTY